MMKGGIQMIGPAAVDAASWKRPANCGPAMPFSMKPFIVCFFYWKLLGIITVAKVASTITLRQRVQWNSATRTSG
jgi:hypothetical protein